MSEKTFDRLYILITKINMDRRSIPQDSNGHQQQNHSQYHL